MEALKTPMWTWVWQDVCCAIRLSSMLPRGGTNQMQLDENEKRKDEEKCMEVYI